MSFRRTAILIAKSFTSAPPRIKGLGIALAWVANFFRRWDVDVETTVFGNRMRLNSSDYLSNIVLFTPNYYDREERAYVRRIVRKGDYVVDVGANIGIYTLILADLVTSTGKSGKSIGGGGETSLPLMTFCRSHPVQLRINNPSRIRALAFMVSHSYC